MIATLSLWIVLPMLSLAVILAFIRLAIGPSLSDRVVALDLIMIMGIGMITIHAIIYQEDSLMESATVLALINFMTTVAFARYLGTRSR